MDLTLSLDYISDTNGDGSWYLPGHLRAVFATFECGCWICNLHPHTLFPPVAGNCAEHFTDPNCCWIELEGSDSAPEQ